jgi:hypothetical protein
MSKKVLDIGSIKNELEGASLYFTKSPTPPSLAIEPPVSLEPPPPADIKPAPGVKVKKVKVDGVAAKSKNDVINERTVESSNERADGKPAHRTVVRHSFDIFADQILSLREIALDQEKLFGERVLLGELVQQALDMLISKEKNK